MIELPIGRFFFMASKENEKMGCIAAHHYFNFRQKNCVYLRLHGFRGSIRPGFGRWLGFYRPLGPFDFNVVKAFLKLDSSMKPLPAVAAMEIGTKSFVVALPFSHPTGEVTAFPTLHTQIVRAN